MRRTLLLLCAAAMATACHRDLSKDTREAARDEVAGIAAIARADAAPPMGMLAKSPAPVSEADDSASTAPTHAGGDSVVSSMLIRTGQASVQVDSLERGIRDVRALATRVGGFVANSSIAAGAEQTHSATLELKIPAARFDEAITALQPIGSLESVNVTAEDVGEEYVDVAARAASEKRLEQRLIEILGTRTGKLSDVLSVERELARVREEIERQEGRMRYLRTRAALSTLAITVHEHYPVVAGTGSSGVLAEAFRQAWRNGIAFIAELIAALGTLLPLGAIVAVVGWGIWRVRRARRAPTVAAGG